MEREGAEPARILAHAWKTSDFFMISPKANRKCDGFGISGREGLGTSNPPCLAGGERSDSNGQVISAKCLSGEGRGVGVRDQIAYVCHCSWIFVLKDAQ